MSARLQWIPDLLPPQARARRFSTHWISQGLRLLCGVLAVAWLLQAPGLAAKEKPPNTLTVSGVVTDKAENGVSGATVTLKDLQTGKTIAIYTGANGQYLFSDLDPHHDYQIQASSRGLTSETRQISSLDTRKKQVINLIISAPQNKE